MSCKKTSSFIAAIALVFWTGACSDNMKSQMGLGRNSPDEFTVVKRAPLTLPPNYGVLPEPGASTADSAALAGQQAKSAVFGEVKGEQPKGSAEDALLGKIGTGVASPEIRRELDREQGEVTLDDKALTERLMFWREEETAVHETLVDPAEEAKRLEQNRQEGKPVNEGDVPVIEREKTVFDKINLF